MIDLSMLEPGTKVKIVNRWHGTGHNLVGHMDKYLGTIMTVREVNDYEVRMVEDECDNGGWFWYENMIEYIVEDTLATRFDESEFLSLIGGE